MATKAAEGQEVRDDMQERAEELVRRITELEDKLVREEGRRPIVSPVPNRPTEAEVREHNITHTPPKPWCPYCVMGTGERDPHAKRKKEVPDVEAVMDKVPTVSIDLMYLFDKGERPTLVMIDHESGRVWSYALKDKTILSGEGWIQRRVVRDIDNAGHKDVKLMMFLSFNA